mgnify:CR=1 FL=1
MNCLFCLHLSNDKELYPSIIDGFKYKWMCYKCKYYLYTFNNEVAFLLFLETISNVAYIIIVSNKYINEFNGFINNNRNISLRNNITIYFDNLDNDNLSVAKIKDKVDNIRLLS